MAQSTRNPWPMRLAIAGAVLIILGAFILNSQNQAIDNAYDPRVMAVAEATGAGGEVVTIEDGCYYAVTLEGENNVDLNLTRIEGSARIDAAEERKICASDWFPMASDGTSFVITEGWDVGQDGEYALDITCQDDADCTNDTVYLVHTNPHQFAILTSPGLLFGMASCCLGITILPLAGAILWLSRMNQSKGSVVMMNPDGTMTQATELTPEMMAAFARGENPLQQNVAPPFADTGLGETEEFIDGKESVMKGSLLTTEQVYALMRGDVEEATQQVSDPFADRPSIHQPATPKKDPNTAHIASWDDGNDETELPAVEERPKVRPIQREKQVDESPADWKSWDDL